ncbi:MAG: tetratricopeptide repeat protein [Candidatus Aminicenantes bacterium]|nr:tetratricopeptide repeat protein [Candidatus Aminicenantes bacterium]
MYLTMAGLLPLPANAVPLEPMFTIRSAHFQSRLRLAAGPDGALFAASFGNNTVAEFLITGEPGRVWDGGPSRSAWLWRPWNVAGSGDGVIVAEIDNRKARGARSFLHVFDVNGKTIRRREIPFVDDLAPGENGSVILAPRIQKPDDVLILIQAPDGSTRSFGEPLPFRHSLAALNARRLAVNAKGEVFVAFTYFPLVRKYSPDGELRGEYRIENPVFEAKEKINLKWIGRGIADADLQGGGYKEIITSIRCLGDRVFLLSCHPRLEIMELDESGGGLATYWMDSLEVYTAHDFIVAEVEGERRFYVSHFFAPRSEIDVFRISNQKPAEGLPGEIERWTAEITADPGSALAYHNRGVARYQSGDFPGAIEDLTKTIEMTPGSASAYYNRGLAEVKTGRYDEAVRDFSKAIEIQPGAAAFFNRGIARARLKDYGPAIADFEKAVEMDPAFLAKSRDQIDYCRKRIKKRGAEERAFPSFRRDAARRRPRLQGRSRG